MKKEGSEQIFSVILKSIVFLCIFLIFLCTFLILLLLIFKSGLVTAPSTYTYEKDVLETSEYIDRGIETPDIKVYEVDKGRMIPAPTVDLEEEKARVSDLVKKEQVTTTTTAPTTIKTTTTSPKTTEATTTTTVDPTTVAPTTEKTASQVVVEKTGGSFLISIGRPNPNYQGRAVQVQDRAFLEGLVMGEFGTSYTGAVLVSQAIRDTMVKTGCYNAQQIARDWGYTAKSRSQVSNDVKQAVAYVFDQGGSAVQHEIYYFYASHLIYSSWHESQHFVVEYGGCRFFS